MTIEEVVVEFDSVVMHLRAILGFHRSCCRSSDWWWNVWLEIGSRGKMTFCYLLLFLYNWDWIPFELTKAWWQQFLLALRSFWHGLLNSSQPASKVGSSERYLFSYDYCWFWYFASFYGKQTTKFRIKDPVICLDP